MFMLDQFLDMTKVKFPTKDHRVVAENALLCNSRYNTLDELINGCKIIASIPEDIIREVTAQDLIAKGIRFHE